MKRFIIACLLLSATMHSQESTPKHLIKFLETNSSHADYPASFFGDDHLVFSTPLDDKGKHPKQDLFIAKFDETGQIGTPTVLGFENRTASKTGFALSADHQTVYFSAKNKRKGKHQLFKATIDKDGLWNNIVRLPFNDNKYHFTSPTLSPDNRKLYFASDNRQSYGGTDIFVVNIQEDGSFDQPVNLGNLINTTGNEVTPFVSASNVLYYSSDGFQASQGGFDVYQSQISEDGFTEPENLDAPINGPHNDIAYIINASNSKGYFSSNRLQGDENTNIYSFLIDHPVVENCEQVIAGVVKDKQTALPIVGAEMVLYNSNNEVVSTHITSQDGAYSFTMDCNSTYTLIATGQSYDKEEHIINTANYRNAPALAANKFLTKTVGYSDAVASNSGQDSLSQGKQGANDATDVASAGANGSAYNQSATSGMEETNAQEAYVKLPEVNAIYFDFDKAYIKQTARPQLDEIVDLMLDNPDVSIELSAYTDSRGPKAYNLYLSQRRLKSTMKYLTNKGIAKARISGEGYGEANIINQCTDGVPCSREDHKKNRRTEFNFISNNAIVRLEKKQSNGIKEKVKFQPKTASIAQPIPQKKPTVTVAKKLEKPVKVAVVEPEVVAKKLPETTASNDKSSQSLVNEDTGTTVAEIKAMIDKGEIVESTTYVGTENPPVKTQLDTGKEKELKKQSELIDRQKAQLEEQLENKENEATEKLIHVKALADNKEDYDRLVEKGVIEEEIKVDSAAEQTKTAPETYARLEEMSKQKAQQEQKKLEKPTKTLGDAASRPFDAASADEDYVPNEMLKILQKKQSDPVGSPLNTTKNTAVLMEDGSVPPVKINSVTVTPMTSKRGKYVSTDRAKKIQALRVNFTLINQPSHPQGYQDAYIVINTPDGKVINQTGTFELATGEEQGYTEQTTVLFNNQDIKVVMFIDRIIQKFVKGRYTVEIYFNGQLSATSNLAIEG